MSQTCCSIFCNTLLGYLIGRCSACPVIWMSCHQNSFWIKGEYFKYNECWFTVTFTQSWVGQIILNPSSVNFLSRQLTFWIAAYLSVSIKKNQKTLRIMKSSFSLCLHFLYLFHFWTTVRHGSGQMMSVVNWSVMVKGVCVCCGIRPWRAGCWGLSVMVKGVCVCCGIRPWRAGCWGLRSGWTTWKVWLPNSTTRKEKTPRKLTSSMRWRLCMLDSSFWKIAWSWVRVGLVQTSLCVSVSLCVCVCVHVCCLDSYSGFVWLSFLLFFIMMCLGVVKLECFHFT